MATNVMATCQLDDRFESKGEKTPEYTALRHVSEKMKRDIDGEKHKVMVALHAAKVIPHLTMDDDHTSDIMSKVLSEVTRNPVLFYALYRVLEENNNNDRYKPVLTELNMVFFDEIRKYVDKSPPVRKDLIGESFMSCCQNKAFSDSPDAYQEALELVDMLKRGGRNPWMEVPSGDSNDYFHTEFSVLKHCGYIVLFMTRGYARSIWNLREFYYAMLLNKRIFLIEIETDQLGLELAGNWLLSQLRRIMQPRKFLCGQYREILEALQEDEDKCGSAIDFPFLTKLEPDKQKRRLVENKLQRETRNIMDQFTVLLCSLEIHLDHKFPVRSLARCINRTLGEKILKLRSVTFEKVFRAIHKNSSFFNYRLVQNIVLATQVITLMDDFKSYQRDFAQYASRRLYLSPNFTGVTLGNAEVVIKTDLKLSNKFHDLDRLIEQVREIFEIEDLPMLTVDEGCIKVVCAVSHHIKQMVFPLSNEQKQALSKLKVLRLCCGKYRYTFKQIPKLSSSMAYHAPTSHKKVSEGGTGKSMSENTDSEVSEGTGTSKSENTEVSEGGSTSTSKNKTSKKHRRWGTVVTEEDATPSASGELDHGVQSTKRKIRKKRRYCTESSILSVEYSGYCGDVESAEKISIIGHYSDSKSVKEYFTVPYIKSAEYSTSGHIIDSKSAKESFAANSISAVAVSTTGYHSDSKNVMTSYEHYSDSTSAEEYSKTQIIMPGSGYPPGLENTISISKPESLNLLPPVLKPLTSIVEVSKRKLPLESCEAYYERESLEEISADSSREGEDFLDQVSVQETLTEPGGSTIMLAGNIYNFNTTKLSTTVSSKFHCIIGS